MAVKQLSTRVSIVMRSAGQSAVEKASYISRQTMHSDYDGTDYRPKAKEDLVHHEVSLPEHAPKEYSDPAVLWNAVEAVEKSKNAQLARMIKFTLPNDWSYEIAEEITRDFIKRNFTSRGMCADWAIHDSVNPKGQRNLHVHVLLTMRPFNENSEWDAKQHKVYVLDEEGNRIPNKSGKGYKCTTEKTTDWDSKENARLWRKNLCGTFNAVNEKLGLDERWEYRSYQEQGIELIPTIHLGPSASALERKGIHTEKGDINREIIRRNTVLIKARQDFEEASAILTLVKRELIDSLADSAAVIAEKTEEAATVVRNALTEMVGKIMSVFQRMLIPTQGKYIYRLRGREKLQSPEYMYRLVRKYHVRDERDLDELYVRLEKKLVRVPEDRAAILTDLAVIESYRYSRHRLQMEVVKGHQPKSLLETGQKDDPVKNLHLQDAERHSVTKPTTVHRQEEAR